MKINEYMKEEDKWYLEKGEEQKSFQTTANGILG